MTVGFTRRYLSSWRIHRANRHQLFRKGRELDVMSLQIETPRQPNRRRSRQWRVNELTLVLQEDLQAIIWAQDSEV